MIRKNFSIVIVLIFTFTINQSVFAYSNEHPTSKEQTFQSADEFYKNVVDKSRYEEYIDSKLKSRKLTTIKGLPKVIDEMNWDYDESYKHPIREDFIEYTKRFNSKRKVYYFFSLKDTSDTVFYKSALYDAKTKELIYADKGNWTKKP